MSLRSIPADSAWAPASRRTPQHGRRHRLLILAVGACFTGAANSVRELIKERVIYERERAVGLSRSAYLMSKVIVLGLITALQRSCSRCIGFAAAQAARAGG